MVSASTISQFLFFTYYKNIIFLKKKMLYYIKERHKFQSVLLFILIQLISIFIPQINSLFLKKFNY